LQSFTWEEGRKEGESINWTSLMKCRKAGLAFEACIGTLHQK